MSEKASSDRGKEVGTANEAKHGEFFCEQCNLDYFTRAQFEEHDWSLLHHQKLERQHANRDFVHICSLCHFSCTGLSAYSKHLISDQHRQTLDQRRKQNWSERHIEPSDFGIQKGGPVTSQSHNAQQYDPGLQTASWDYDNYGNKQRSFTDHDLTNSSLYHSFTCSDVNRPAHGDVFNTSYTNQQPQYNYSFSRPQSAPGFHQGEFYRQDRPFSPQGSSRNNPDFKRRNPGPYQKYSSSSRNYPRNAPSQSREEPSRSSSPVFGRIQCQSDRRAGGNLGNHKRSSTVSSFKSSARETGSLPEDRPRELTSSVGKSDLHRKSSSLGAVSVKGLGSSKLSNAKPSSYKSKALKDKVETGQQMSGSRTVSKTDSATAQSRSGNEKGASAKGDNSEVRKSRGDSSSAVQRMHEAKAKKEELRKNQTNITELKQRIARGNAARSQKHLEEMDRSLKTVYSRELGKVQRPERQASPELRAQSLPAQIRVDYSRNSSVLLDSEFDSPSAHSSRRAEFEKKYGDLDTTVDSPVLMPVKSRLATQCETTEVHHDGIDWSGVRHGLEYDYPRSMDRVATDFDGLQQNIRSELHESGNRISQSETGAQNHKPTSSAPKSKRYVRADSYPQGSIADKNHRSEVSDKSTEASNATSQQYQRSKSSEIPSSDSGREDQHSEGNDLDQLSLPPSLQKDLSKHIAATNIARSEGIAQPNLGQARSRLHIGQRPQGGESHDVGLKQRLLQLMSSPHSKHRQEKQFERLKQHVQAKKPASRLPRFGLQLLPSHMTLPLLMADASFSQDEADHSQGEGMHMSDLDCRSPSPSSVVGTKRSHSDMDTRTTETVVLEKEKEPKRRKVKTERLSPPLEEVRVSSPGVDVDTLYQISLKEEELLNSMAALNASVAEMKDFIQKKMEELQKIEAVRDKASEEMASLRRRRMSILKGAVSQGRTSTGVPGTEAQEEQTQVDTHAAAAIESENATPQSSCQTEQSQPQNPVVVKTEPVGDGYEAANESQHTPPPPPPQQPPPTPPLDVEHPSAIIEQLVKNPQQFQFQEVYSSRQAAARSTAEGSSNRQTPAAPVKQAHPESQKSQRGGGTQESSRTKKDDKPVKASDRRGKTREAVAADETSPMSDEETPPHLRSLEALQNSTSLDVSTISASSSTLRQLASNFLELKNASMLLLQEESAAKGKKAAQSAPAEPSGEESKKVKTEEVGADQVEHMELCTTVTSSQEGGGTRSSGQKTTREGKEFVEGLHAKRGQYVRSAAFQAVIESIMQDSDVEFLGEYRDSNPPSSGSSDPQEEASPAWVTPLSKDVRSVVKDRYKNPFSKKPVKEHREVDRGQEMNEQDDSVHVNVRDYRSCGNSQVAAATAKKGVTSSSEVGANRQGDNAAKTSGKCKDSQEGKKVKKKKKPKPPSEVQEHDSDTDESPRLLVKQKAKKKPKTKAKSRESGDRRSRVAAEDSVMTLAPPLPQARRRRQLKMVNPDELILPLHSYEDSDPQPSTSYKLCRMPSEEAVGEEGEQDTLDTEVAEVPQMELSDLQVSEIYPEMPSSVSGAGESTSFSAVVEKGEGDSVEVLEVLSYDEEPMATGDSLESFINFAESLERMNSSKSLPISTDVVSSTSEVDLTRGGSPTEEETTRGTTNYSPSRFSVNTFEVSPAIREKIRQMWLGHSQKCLPSRKDTTDKGISQTTATTPRGPSAGSDAVRPRVQTAVVSHQFRPGKSPAEITKGKRPKKSANRESGKKKKKVKAQVNLGLFKSFHQDTITDLEVLSHHVFSSSADRTIRKWNIVTGECVTRYKHHSKNGADGILYSNSIGLVSFTRGDHTLQIFGKTGVEKVKVPNKVSCMCYNYRLFIGSTSGIVYYYETSEFKQSFNVCSPHAVTSIITANMNRTGNYLLVGSGNSDITVHNIENLVKLFTLGGHTNAVVCMKVMNYVVYSGSADTFVLAHNIRTGEQVGRFGGHEGAVTDFCLSHKRNTKLVTACLDKFIRVFDLTNQTCLHKFGGFPSIAKSIVTLKYTNQLLLYVGCQDGSLYGLPFDNEHVFNCQWTDCGLSFMMKEHLVDHLQIDHVESDQDTNIFRCFWNDCKKLFAWKKNDTEILKEVHNHLSTHV